MIKPGSHVAVYDTELAKKAYFFTGGMNLQQLDFDPFVSGYAIIIWKKVPSWVTSEFPGFSAMTQKNFKSFDGLSDMELQTGQYEHSFNGNQYDFATTIQKNNTEFTIKHQEFSGSPIKNMYQHWVTGIRDPRTDIAQYPKRYGLDYCAKNHTGELLYIVTRPDINNVGKNNIEFAAYYTNVMPTKVPFSHLNFNLNEHNPAEIDITFKGTLNIGKKVDDFAAAELAKHFAFITEGNIDPSDTGWGNMGLQDNDNISTVSIEPPVEVSKSDIFDQKMD